MCLVLAPKRRQHSEHTVGAYLHHCKTIDMVDCLRLEPSTEVTPHRVSGAGRRHRLLDPASLEGLFVPGCFNAMSARILDKVGFPAVYMTGYGTSLSLLGMPDAGLATMTEMQMNFQK